jgi:hypothetical protein
MGFQELLKANGINHFSQGEVFINEKPPAELWPNIIPTLIVLEHFRNVVGKPLYISSAYRSQERNADIGASKSLHIDFNAIDFKGLVEEDRKDIYYKIKSLINKGFILDCYFGGRQIKLSPKIMGIGYYPEDFRFHIDTRALIGRTAPARWNG